MRGAGYRATAGEQAAAWASQLLAGAAPPSAAERVRATTRSCDHPSPHVSRIDMWMTTPARMQQRSPHRSAATVGRNWLAPEPLT